MHSRSILFTISLVVLIPFVANADSAIQADWSGGPGIWGPVTAWGNNYYLSDSISSSSQLRLDFMFTELFIDRDFDGAYSIYSEDIDGDGDMDVLGAARNDDDITWWENLNGSGTSWTEHIVDTDFAWATSVYSEDINNDGNMDVLGAAGVDDDITWWENEDGSGTFWVEHTVDENFNGANSVFSEDIDNDGDMDILGAAYTDDDITWWENLDGSGTSWTEHTVDGNFNGAVSVYSEDIDGDGDMDVLGAARNDDDITWWENLDGSGTSWTEHIIDGSFDGACSIYSEDIDDDGDMDILGAARYADDISWWENLDGSGTSWTEHSVDVDFGEVESVYSEDIDSDGDMDILGAACFDDDITWWENLDGSGSSWVEHTVDGDFDYAKSVYSEDIDGDGNMDILGAAGEGNDIAWWHIAGYQRSGSLESSILNTDTQPLWDYIEWSSYVPIGTSVSFQVRASDNYTNMGAWSDTLTSSCSLAGILSDGDRYMQYRAILSTSDPDTTSILNDITITWDPLGVQGNPQVTEYLLLGAEPNPASGSASIGFAVPVLSVVELSVYDLTGRLVTAPAEGEYSVGVHQVQFGELTPGIYFCRMSAGDFTGIQRFAVID